MKVLIVGNGGREHALAWKIRQSPLVHEVYCAPGNAGIASIADCVPIDSTNIIEVADFAQTIKADLTVVGPELPAVLGIADEFHRRGLTIFCPSRAASELEGSKAFAREFMDRHQIPSPGHRVCGSIEEAREFLKTSTLGYPLVIKADGLAAGKGVVIAANLAEAEAAVNEMMTDKKFGLAGARVVFEQFLEGEEVSFLVFSDGAKVVPMVSAQDHKRAFDADQGPNTGGMGAVSPATNLSVDVHKQIMHTIVVPTVAGMAAEGRRYQGVLYAGLMLTDDGPKVLEFNTRFGDPEAQVILTRMKSDLVPILQGVADGHLPETKIDWLKDSAVCVVLASAGYPDSPQTGKVVSGLDGVKEEDVIVFHAATAAKDGATVTVGGRVFGVTAIGASLEAAIQRAYETIPRITFDGMHYRKDIGQKALARLRKPNTDDHV
jgi:phosphoribosylamine--glycine ligase